MLITKTEIPGVLVLEPQVFRDERGYFQETYHLERYREAGIQLPFVQDNQSYSLQNVLRGLHMQIRKMQGKLVRVVSGEVFDVAVDVRRNSPTFMKWVGVRLSSENQRQFYIPPGFAYGFCVLSSAAIFEYKCTEFYSPADELTIAWNDPDIGIAWPIAAPILGRKDREAPALRAVLERLPE